MSVHGVDLTAALRVGVADRGLRVEGRVTARVPGAAQVEARGGDVAVHGRVGDQDALAVAAVLGAVT